MAVVSVGDPPKLWSEVRSAIIHTRHLDTLIAAGELQQGADGHAVAAIALRHEPLRRCHQ